MILYEQEVVNDIIDMLADYTIKDDNDLQNYVDKVINRLIDPLSVDLFESAYFLYHEGYLDEVRGNIIEVLILGQYKYYRNIAEKNMIDIYKNIKFEK
jgi:hypothetical protein